MSDIWGTLPTPLTARTPYQILEEQSALLAEKSNGLLQGQVERKTRNDEVSLNFYIVVPNLNGYKYQLCSVFHRVQSIWPVRIFASERGYEEHENEEEFLQDLGEIIRSPRVQRALESFITQASEQ